jgi:integrase
LSDIAGVHFVRIAARDGTHRWYIYAWRGGPRIATIDGGPKPRLSRELEQAVKDARARAQAGDETIGGLIRDWRRSPEWEAFAFTTKRAWSTWTARIEDKWGKTPLEVWSDPRMVGKVIAWRDGMKDTPRSADEAVKVLSRLLEWGRLRARVRLNVAEGVPQLYKGADRSTIIWTPEDYDRFTWAAGKLDLPQALDVRDLGGLTGFRRADLAGLTRAEAAYPHAIMRTALKKSRGRRRRAVIPKLEETQVLLDRLATQARKEDVETVLVNSYGRAWTPQSLGDCFHRVRDHAGIVEPANRELGLPARPKHLHDLRGTFVTHLCRAQPPLTDEQIAEITAWSPQNVNEIRRTYVDDAAIVVAIGERLSAARKGRA